MRSTTVSFAGSGRRTGLGPERDPAIWLPSVGYRRMWRHVGRVVIACVRWRLAGYDWDRHRAPHEMLDPAVSDMFALVADTLTSPPAVVARRTGHPAMVPAQRKGGTCR